MRFVPGVSYRRIDDQGLHYELDGEPQLLAVDSIILCTGQDSLDELSAPLSPAGLRVHVIGGAREAAELDAFAAIAAGTELAAQL